MKSSQRVQPSCCSCPLCGVQLVLGNLIHVPEQVREHRPGWVAAVRDRSPIHPAVNLPAVRIEGVHLVSAQIHLNRHGLKLRGAPRGLQALAQCGSAAPGPTSRRSPSESMTESSVTTSVAAALLDRRLGRLSQQAGVMEMSKEGRLVTNTWPRLSLIIPRSARTRTSLM